MTHTRYFNGTSKEPSENYKNLPIIDPKGLTDPRDYRASAELAAAVNVAMTLGMPLLLTGEPGCGKSELARRIAWELGFPQRPDSNELILKYVVKSTTEAKDLFYTFDAVGRFHAVQTWKLAAETNSRSDSSDIADKNTAELPAVDAANFIEYQAMGLAILHAKGKNGDIPDHIISATDRAKLPSAPQRSVVLIDEIDKAPRDVPNDILNEIEHLEFTIPELGGVRVGINHHDHAYKPVVIITSNSERDLPAAFLRRCVYYHVPFPPFSSENSDASVTVESIVDSRMGKRFTDLDHLRNDGLSLCRYLRQSRLGLVKLPSLAEILNWLRFLVEYVDGLDLDQGTRKNYRLKNIEYQHCLEYVKTTLLKTREDQERAATLFSDWLAKQS